MQVLRLRDFRALWSAATVSQAGTQLSAIALPLLVITTLHASTFAVGLLTACETAAFLLVGLPAGAWVDRIRRRPVLVASDVLRALLLASLPAAWWIGGLTLAQVYAVTLVVGLCTVFFDVAHQSYVPSLVDRRQLVSANANLEISASAAATAGPAVGGAVVQALGAPVALAADALSYVVSAVFLSRIRGREPEPVAPAHPRLLGQVAEGLRFVVHHPLLRPIAMCTAVANLGMSLGAAVLLVFFVRTLHLSAGAIGLLLSAGAVGGLIGALTAGWFSRRVGQARAIWLGPLLTAPWMVVLPLAQRGPLLVLVVVAELVPTIGFVYYNVAQVSLRQVITPGSLLGRMNASMRFLVWGPRPLGGVIGGALGDTIGLRPTMWVAVLVAQVALVPLLLSPLRAMRHESAALVPAV